jgi:23S rRNA (uridine2552-2'-O)-methyltransferase
MSKLGRREGRHDHYFHKARQEHFASRAVFKLKAIDERFHLLRTGMRVLDLGCWPGSWLQHAADRVGPSGRVVGIDRAALEIALPNHVTSHVGNVYDVAPRTLLGDLAAFDVVLSDMAPDTTGIKFTDAVRSVALVERALEIACAVLVPGGALVAKIFVGEGFDPLLNAMKLAFRHVKMVKPDSSRKESPEQYIVAQDRKATGT